jgi:hypothetical protein
MDTLLIILLILSIGVSVMLAISNAKLKANSAKLKVENENLQYELGKSFLNNGQDESEDEGSSLSKDRIESIKEKYLQTSEIKPLKKATKKEVDAFYESQKTTKNKRRTKIIEQ